MASFHVEETRPWLWELSLTDSSLRRWTLPSTDTQEPGKQVCASEEISRTHGGDGSFVVTFVSFKRFPQVSRAERVAGIIFF